MDPCPHGATSKDLEEFKPEWFEPAQYRIPVSDQEHANPATSTIVRTTALSKTRCESLLAVIHTFNAITAPNNNQANGAVATLATVVLENMGKFDVYLSMLYRNLGRKPFLTESGYVGIGPGGMKKGDVVSVFLGAELPYVLRRAGDVGGWFLVGDAYVHGVMDGEIVEKGSSLETYELV